MTFNESFPLGAAYPGSFRACRTGSWYPLLPSCHNLKVSSTRKNTGTLTGRQRSKHFVSPTSHSIQQPHSFTRTYVHGRQRSRRFKPSHPRTLPATHSCCRHTSLNDCACRCHRNLPLEAPPLPPLCAEPDPLESLLSVESVALTSTLPAADILSFETPQCNLHVHSSLCADPPVFVPAGEQMLLQGSPVEFAAPCTTFCLPHDNLFTPQFHPPIRPNTDPRINSAPSANDTSLPRVSSSLNRDAWAYFLRDYPDRAFVNSILHIIDHGANIGFDGDRSLSQSSRNLPSAFDHPEAVESAIETQLKAGRIRGPFSAPPFPQFRSSPLGVAARKHSGKLRQIHHLSWPRGRSVNDGIPDSEASIIYDMFSRAAEDLVRSGPGSLMIKLDLEQAFRHIPIRPSDWPLLGYQWEGSFYYELFLMFGLRSAPYIFNLFSEALHWILEHHIPASIRHYLDDFLKIFRPDTPAYIVHSALVWTRALARALGLNFQDSKVEGPTTLLEFLGIILDSIRMEARLPLEKLQYLQHLLSTWSSKSHCTKHELEELTGYLQFCSQVIPYSRAFLRSMFDFTSTFNSPFSRRRISRHVRRDLKWWSTFSSSWNGIHFLQPTRPVVVIFTDASGTKGAGGTFDSQWFSIRMPPRYSGAKRDIQFKEFYAIIHAILCWGPDFSGKHVIFHTDNQDVDSALRKLTIRSPPTMELVRQFLGLACRLDFTFESCWIPTKQNGIADAASRFQFTRMFELAPHLSRTPSPKILSLTHSSFEPSASRPSAHL